MKKNNIFGIIIVIILCSCAVPSPLVKITPSTIHEKDYWNLGQQFVYKDYKNVWFDCAYNRCEGGNLIFDVKVSNQSDTAILVDPALFSQNVYENDSQKIAYNYAYNPEVVLTSLEMDENASVASAKNAAVFGLCSSVLSLGASVAVIASNKSNEDKSEMLNVISSTNELAQSSSSAVIESSNIRAENNWTRRKSLAESFLRKTTLPKGYFIEGEVHFPYYEKANWYDINLCAGKSEVSFLFKQNLIYANSYNNIP